MKLNPMLFIREIRVHPRPILIKIGELDCDSRDSDIAIMICPRKSEREPSGENGSLSEEKEEEKNVNTVRSNSFLYESTITKNLTAE